MIQFKNKISIFLMCFFLIGNSLVFPQQASTVSDTVSISGINTPSPGRLQIDPNASALDSTINPYNISIPEQFGQIEEVFQGDAASPLIVHVQNVHANYEAQINIKKILSHLVDQYQFSLIQLEGAVSKLDPAILQPSYLKEANLKLVDFLMRAGRITGADAFAVETDKSVEMYGIEDYSLYMENLKMFKIIYKHQEDLKPYFDEIHRLILTVGPKLLNPESLDFTRKTEEFSTDKIDLLDYLSYMNKLSEKHKLTSLNDLSQMVNYPNLTRLMRLNNLEEELNKAGLKKETEAIKFEFKKKMPDSAQVDELLSRLDESAKGTNPRAYFLELTKLADEAKIDFIAYPAFRIFAEFLIHQDEIDHRDLFSELKQFENMLQEKLFTSEDEQLFLSIIDRIGLLEQFFRLEMSREKIVFYLKDKETVKPSWVYARLDELAKKNNVVSKPVGDLKTLDSYIGDVEYYYQLVLRRDEVFIDKILTKTKSMSLDKTIIVTGGFHKDGLIDYFRKEKISYVIINPKVDVKEGNQNYLKVMLEEDAVAGSVFAGTFALELRNFIDVLLRTGVDQKQTVKLYAAIAALTRGLQPEVLPEKFIEDMNISAEKTGVPFKVLSVEGTNFIKVKVAASIEGLTRVYLAEFNVETQAFTVTIDDDEPIRVSELPKFQPQPPQAQIPTSPINRTALKPLEEIPLPFSPVKKVATLAELIRLARVVNTFVLPNEPIAPNAESAVQALLRAPPIIAAAGAEQITRNLKDTQGEVTPEQVEAALKTIAALTGQVSVIRRQHIEQAARLLGLDKDRVDLLESIINEAFEPSTANEGEPKVLVIPVTADMSDDVVGSKIEFLAKILKGNPNSVATFLYVSALQKDKVNALLSKFGIQNVKNLKLVSKRDDQTLRKELSTDLQTGQKFFNKFQKLNKPEGMSPVNDARGMLEGGYVRVILDDNDEGKALGQKIGSIQSNNVIQLFSPDQVRLSQMKRNDAQAVAAFGLPVLVLIPSSTDISITAVKIREDVFEAINREKDGWHINTAKLSIITELYALYQRALIIAAAA